MADITERNQGNVDDCGKVNWRGDQVSVPQGGQSIYDTSTVQLADLGSRKIVGDRVFRYALASGAAGAGDICQSAPKSLVNVTGGNADPAGGKVFTFYFATANDANVYAEGSLHCQSGTAANMGYMYRIKSHPAVATTSECTLTLYDPLKRAVNVTDTWTIHQNPYAAVLENTSGAALAIGAAPIAVTSGEYFWLQTYGPMAIKSSAVAAAGIAIAPGATGESYSYVVATTAKSASVILGQSMQVMTASQYGMAFITIAP